MPRTIGTALQPEVYPCTMPSRHQTLTPRPETSRALLALLLLAAVSACGQKGPLYLPERTPMVIGQDDDAADQNSRQPATGADSGEAAQAEQADEDDDNGEPRRIAPESGP